ncbi:MAG TPA: dihydropteroate synthase [Cyclobacteriaceae bacterium]|nr:dihydropteroate synthase [Cyclobacteriaceae bacterium]HMV09067.1 dihydropteroate synthase [Cyclobacteriaceae bacterium]HMV91309.1 dihydropteroate synthase [Cyclobacteriaceae bacterium]HMW99528.1 dihydropteroate synthase [Cyclobacteriaceae bacterium]HMX51689.1 dihydropteroate synthase [Cyclobacteriaceae bacterium]
MGILNVTPDSFFSGSRVTAEAEVLKQAEKMLSDGATFLDVGGYSSRPGAEDISIDEERRRVITAIKVIVKKFPGALISVDTFRGCVAREAVQEGACVINDISAGTFDPNMLETVASLNVPYIAMHMRGNPQTMNSLTQYQNLISEITDYFIDKTDRLKSLGVNDIIIDPGFGFAKTIDQNFELLTHLDYFKNLNRPILAGLSRKSMIWKTLGITPEEALSGTTALNMTALLKGADILRVHDVKEAVQVIRLFTRL